MLNDEQRDTCIPFSLKLIKLGYYLYQAGNKLILSVRLFVGRITQKLLNRYHNILVKRWHTEQGRNDQMLAIIWIQIRNF